MQSQPAPPEKLSDEKSPKKLQNSVRSANFVAPGTIGGIKCVCERTKNLTMNCL